MLVNNRIVYRGQTLDPSKQHIYHDNDDGDRIDHRLVILYPLVNNN